MEENPYKAPKAPTMRHFQLVSYIVLLSYATFCSADETAQSPSQDELTAIIELRRAGATLELDAQGHAVSLTWETGKDGDFSDKHMPQVATLKHLKELWLEHTSVTDAGLAQLKSTKQLETLAIICEFHRGKPATITDAGMKHLAGLTNLRVLRLDDTDVTDAGLVQFQPLMNLEDLDLFGTEVSDAGLVHLRGLTNLQYLGLAETQWEKTGGAITAGAVRALQKYLPHCEMYY